MSALRASVLALVVLAACGGPNGGMDGSVDAYMDIDGGPPVDSGTIGNAFLATLDSTVWNALQTRTETGGAIQRAYEMHFTGGGSPMWGEIRNPYGPARLRIRRFIRIESCESVSICTINTVISIPDTTWETPPELRGRMERWRIEIIDGVSRILAIRNEATGVEEQFNEGAWPVPTSGLTAEYRLYSESGPITDSFCVTGPNFDNAERATLWGLARGTSDETVLAYDVVAGAPLMGWVDISNLFGVRDVNGFDINTLGGSERTDQSYFTVRYSGVIHHPGGSFRMRERDDLVEDGVWSFINTNIGANDICSLFLEVQNYATLDDCNCTDVFCDDATNDEPQVDLTAGDIPIEILVVRCMMPFEDDMHVEMSLGGASSDPPNWQLVGDQPSLPEINTDLFPPVL